MIGLVGDNRTRLALKNIAFSLILKGVSILASFLLIPATLGYLSDYEYGIWLTLSSVMSWVYLLDIGLGNGLRNKLAEALAAKNHELAKTYVSSTYFFLILIILLFIAIFVFVNQFLDWYKILNVDPHRVKNLNLLVCVVITLTCVGFVFRIVGNIYMAMQMSSINDLLLFIGNLLSLITIYLLIQYSNGSLSDVAISYSLIPAVVYLVASLITFFRYKFLRPAIKYIKRRYFHDLVTMGVKYLIIQVAGIVIFATSNIIISNMFGPSDVTPYNISNKYFSLAITGFTIFLTPFWSAITDAYTKGEIDWIRKSLKRMMMGWIIFVFIAVVMILVGPLFFRLWIKDQVIIPYSMIICWAIYSCVSNLNKVYTHVLNGMGVLKLQLIFCIIEAVIFIPLTILLAKWYGLNGMIVSLTIILALSLLYSPIQCRKLLNGTARGIWKA